MKENNVETIFEEIIALDVPEIMEDIKSYEYQEWEINANSHKYISIKNLEKANEEEKISDWQINFTGYINSKNRYQNTIDNSFKILR